MTYATIKAARTATEAQRLVRKHGGTYACNGRWDCASGLSEENARQLAIALTDARYQVRHPTVRLVGGTYVVTFTDPKHSMDVRFR